MEQEEAMQEIFRELEIRSSSGNFRDQLEEKINDLLVSDFNKLVSVLYRIDINEEKLKRLLKDQPGKDAAKIIAEQMILRQLEKAKSRQQFSKPQNNIDEEEKW